MEDLKKLLKSKTFKDEAYKFLMSNKSKGKYKKFSFKFDSYFGNIGFFASVDDKNWVYIPKIKKGFSKKELDKIFKKDESKLKNEASSDFSKENVELLKEEKKRASVAFLKNKTPKFEKGIVRTFIKTLNLDEDVKVNTNKLYDNKLLLLSNKEKILVEVNEDINEYFVDLAKEVNSGKDFNKYFKIKRIEL